MKFLQISSHATPYLPAWKAGPAKKISNSIFLSLSIRLINEGYKSYCLFNLLFSIISTILNYSLLCYKPVCKSDVQWGHLDASIEISEIQ